MSVKSMLIRFAGAENGNIALMAALTAPIVVVSLALGVDYGNLTLERRALQQTADLSAIVGAAEAGTADAAVLNFMALNNKNIALLSQGKLVTQSGTTKYDPNTVFSSLDGYAVVTKGRYTSDSSIAVGKRFVENATPYDAVKVAIVQKTQLFFGGWIATAPHIQAQSTAAVQKLATFSVGSRLVSLNGGILNAVLGKLLGTSVSLDIMDYNQLLNADIDVLKLANSLGSELKITAGTYSQLLDTDISYGTFLSALGKTTGMAPATATIVARLEKSLNKTQVTLKLGEIVNLSPYQNRAIGSTESMLVNASVFDLITGAAIAANGGKQFSVNLDTIVPGLASATLDLAIGEPPVATPAIRAGQEGSIVRTAQTRLALTVGVNGLSPLAGLTIKVPIYAEIATAEAKLDAINCYGGARNNASVTVDVVPGVAELAIGTVDMQAFDNFGTTPRVTKAQLVNSLLLNVSGYSHADADNMKAKSLTFQPSEIIAGKVKTVSTKDTLTSLMISLIGDLKFDISLLAIPLTTPDAVQKALTTTLSVATVPLDNVLYNTLLMLGIRIGEADTRVTAVSCQSPVLVQ